MALRGEGVNQRTVERGEGEQVVHSEMARVRRCQASFLGPGMSLGCPVHRISCMALATAPSLITHQASELCRAVYPSAHSHEVPSALSIRVVISVQY